ncbi:hypothetical protein [Roseibium sp.]|uniref:hypothetical protein n=1 Tax=Roseibium sp. TaxID=1936156 RepID=UPI0032662835
MRSILSSSQYSRAKVPLKMALNALNQKARSMPGLSVVAEPGRVQRNGQAVVVNPRFDPLLNPGTPQQRAAYQMDYVQTYSDARKREWRDHMERHIRSTFEWATPTSDAVRSLDRWLGDAIDCGYPVYDADVRKLLCGVILMERTEGYVNEDTTGTQMGNFRGEWRGGGFGK